MLTWTGDLERFATRSQPLHGWFLSDDRVKSLRETDTYRQVTIRLSVVDLRLGPMTSSSRSAVVQSRAIARGVRAMYLSAGLDIQDASRLTGIPVRRLRRCCRHTVASLRLSEVDALAVPLGLTTSGLIESALRESLLGAVDEFGDRHAERRCERRGLREVGFALS